MADSKVSALVDEALSTSASDWMYIASYNGVDWTSKKIKPDNVGGKNFANANLTLTGNRSHDGNSNRLTMAKFKDMTFETFIAPTLGLASLNFNGYGTSDTDLTHEFNSDNGVTMRMYGNNTSRYYGDVYMNALRGLVFNDNSNLTIRQSSSANAIEIKTNNASVWNFGWDSSEGGIRAVGALGATAIALVSSSANTLIRHANSTESIYWESGRLVDDYIVRGLVGSGSPTLQEVFKVKQTTGEVEFLIGKLKSVLQVGNSGLTSGQWYQDTSANVLANGDKVIAIKQ